MNQAFQYSIDNEFKVSEVTVKGEKQYFVEGYVSTIDEDKAGEIIEYSAQQDIYNQIKDNSLTMDIEHEEWYNSNGEMLARPKNERIPVAKVVEAELRPRGVWVKAMINTHLKSFSQIWGSIKDGFLKAFSVAFYPTEKVGNRIKHLNVINSTLTGSPVNSGAGFTAQMKSAVAYLDALEANKQLIKDGAIMPAMVSIKSEPPKMEEKTMENTPEIKNEPITEVNPAIDEVKAEIKALQEKYDTALKAHSEEVAKLKAELEKPIMKAEVTKEMPKEQIAFKPVDPLQLIR